MKSRNLSTQWWEGVKTGKIPAMQRLKENDPNNQVVSLERITDANGQVRMVAMKQ
jgi:hypothetical protein